MANGQADIALEAKPLSQYDLLQHEAEEILQLFQKISVFADPKKHSIQKIWLDVKFQLENRTIGEDLSSQMAETILAITKSHPTGTDINDFFIQSHIIDKLVQFSKNMATAYRYARDAINGENKAAPASGHRIGQDEALAFYTCFFEDIDRKYFDSVNNFYNLFASSCYFSGANAHAITSFCGALIYITTPEKKSEISARDAHQRLAEQKMQDRPEAIIDRLRCAYAKKEKGGISKDTLLKNFSTMSSAALDHSQNIIVRLSKINTDIENKLGEIKETFKMRKKMEADICAMRQEYIVLNNRYVKKCYSREQRSAQMKVVESKADALAANMRQFSNEYFDNLPKADSEKIASIFVEYNKACIASYNDYLENRIAVSKKPMQAVRSPLKGVILTPEGKTVPVKSLAGKKVFINYMQAIINSPKAASEKLKEFHQELERSKKYIAAERHLIKSCLKYVACFFGCAMMLSGVLYHFGAKLIGKFQPGKSSQGGLFAQSAEKSRRLKELADSQMEHFDGRHSPL